MELVLSKTVIIHHRSGFSLQCKTDWWVVYCICFNYRLYWKDWWNQLRTVAICHRDALLMWHPSIWSVRSTKIIIILNKIFGCTPHFSLDITQNLKINLRAVVMQRCPEVSIINRTEFSYAAQLYSWPEIFCFHHLGPHKILRIINVTVFWNRSLNHFRLSGTYIYHIH